MVPQTGQQSLEHFRILLIYHSPKNGVCQNLDLLPNGCRIICIRWVNKQSQILNVYLPTTLFPETISCKFCVKSSPGPHSTGVSRLLYRGLGGLEQI